MRITNRFEDIDRAALHKALLALHTCPYCRYDLRPVKPRSQCLWWCDTCNQSYKIIPEDAQGEQ